MNAQNVRPFLKPVLSALIAFAPLALSQTNYETTLASIQSLLASQQFQRAAEESQRAIRIDGNRWEGYVMAATAYTGMKMPSDAVTALNQALVRAPEDKHAQLRTMIDRVQGEIAERLAQLLTLKNQKVSIVTACEMEFQWSDTSRGWVLFADLDSERIELKKAVSQEFSDSIDFYFNARYRSRPRATNQGKGAPDPRHLRYQILVDRVTGSEASQLFATLARTCQD